MYLSQQWSNIKARWSEISAYPRLREKFKIKDIKYPVHIVRPKPLIALGVTMQVMPSSLSKHTFMDFNCNNIKCAGH